MSTHKTDSVRRGFPRDILFHNKIIGSKYRVLFLATQNIFWQHYIRIIYLYRSQKSLRAFYISENKVLFITPTKFYRCLHLFIRVSYVCIKKPIYKKHNKYVWITTDK